MGAVDTTYTFTATDTITSAKMNNIIDQTTMTSQACLTGGGLEVASGQLTIASGAINSSRLAANAVTNTSIANGSVTPVKLSSGGPNWTGTGAGGIFTVSQTALEFGTGNTQDFGCFIDLHAAATPTDFETRILRDSGANGDFKIWNQGTGSITLGSTSEERLRIASSGNVGIGTSTPGAKLEIKGSTVDDNTPELKISGSAGHLSTYVSLNTGAYNPIVLDQDKAIIFTEGTTEAGNLVIAPHSSSVGGVRITSSGNVGIKKASPSTALDVNGTVTATAFAGPLTGDVTGNVTGSASTVSDGAITAAKLNGDQTGSAPIFGTRAWASFDGRFTQVTGKAYTRSGTTVTVTNAGHGLSTGNILSISSATDTGLNTANNVTASVKITVVDSNSFTFQTNSTGASTGTLTYAIGGFSSGNISSIARTATGKWTITFSTGMSDANYCILANAKHATGVNVFTNTWPTGLTSTTFDLNVMRDAGVDYNSEYISFVVMK